MPASRVERPVVRSFKPRYLREAAAHVRAGGHAVVWESERRARLLMPVPAKGDVTDLGYWSLLDLGKQRYRLVKDGPAKGLATALVPNDCLDIVRRRAERDSIHPGARRALELDCLACGACCRDNRVELEPSDLARFRDGGRVDLTRPPYTTRRNGKVVLRLAPDKACQHLLGDNKCAIYTLRPDACSQFPVGSECCLYAREAELGVVDGLTEGA
jgi:hypothetical protein